MKKIIPLILTLALAGCAGASNESSKSESKAETSAVDKTTEQVSSDATQDIPDNAKEIAADKITTGVTGRVTYDSEIMNYDYMVDSAEEYEVFKGFCGDVPEFDDIDFDDHTMFAKTGAGSSGDEYVIDKVLLFNDEIVMLDIKKTKDGMTDDLAKRWFYAVVPKEELPADIKGWKRPSETDFTKTSALLVNAYIAPESFDSAEYVAILEKYEAFEATVKYLGKADMLELHFLSKSSDKDGIDQDIRNSFTVKKTELDDERFSVDNVDVLADIYGTPPESYESGSLFVSIPLTEPSRQSNEAADYIMEAFGEPEWIASPEADRIEGTLEREDFPVDKLQSGIEALYSASSKFDTKLDGFSLRYTFN